MWSTSQTYLTEVCMLQDPMPLLLPQVRSLQWALASVELNKGLRPTQQLHSATIGDQRGGAPALQLLTPAVCEGVALGTYAGAAGVLKRTCDMRRRTLALSATAGAGDCASSTSTACNIPCRSLVQATVCSAFPLYDFMLISATG